MAAWPQAVQEGEPWARGQPGTFVCPGPVRASGQPDSRLLVSGSSTGRVRARTPGQLLYLPGGRPAGRAHPPAVFVNLTPSYSGSSWLSCGLHPGGLHKVTTQGSPWTPCILAMLAQYCRPDGQSVAQDGADRAGRDS